MKRLTLLLIIFCATGSYSASTWAELIYECTGETGEASYSERPCDSATRDHSPTARARYAAHDERLEQVKSEKIALKRKLMDLDREYYYSLSQVSPDEQAALVQQHEQQTQLINSEIRLLTQSQTLLVGQTFDELIEQKSAN